MRSRAQVLLTKQEIALERKGLEAERLAVTNLRQNIKDERKSVGEAKSELNKLQKELREEQARAEAERAAVQRLKQVRDCGSGQHPARNGASQSVWSCFRSARGPTFLASEQLPSRPGKTRDVCCYRWADRVYRGFD